MIFPKNIAESQKNHSRTMPGQIKGDSEPQIFQSWNAFSLKPQKHLQTVREQNILRSHEISRLFAKVNAG